MKRKLFYILIIFCCIGIFSYAKQNKMNCDKQTVCSADKQKIISNKRLNKDKGFDLSPLQQLVFGI